MHIIGSSYPSVTAGVEMVGAGPWLEGGIGNLLQDLVVHGGDVGIFSCAAPSDAAPTPGSSGAMSLGVSGPYRSGSPGSSSPPINSTWVEGKAKSTCSQVATVE
jgi:hypothetical protein